VFDRASCTLCGQCAQTCRARALEQIGRQMTIADVMAEVLKDRAFYETSGGGLTLSGGEPMAQFEFTRALLLAAKAEGLHTALETCGFAAIPQYQALVACVDLFLFDYKMTDPARHRACTGVDNRRILENLSAIAAANGSIVLRCPIVPGLNDGPEHFAAIAATANRLKAVRAIHVLPYHPLGEAKRARLGRDQALYGQPFAGDGAAQQWIAAIAAAAQVPVTTA
jgi:glycyl-radical enzyme activating protein